MSVSTIMTQPVVTIDLDESILAARQTLAERGIRHLVVTEQSRVVGVISDRDLLSNLSPFLGTMSERAQDLNSLKRRVHQIMSRRVRTVRPETPLVDAALLMLEHKISCLPVVDASGQCVGVVTTRDMLIWSLRCMQGEGHPAACRLPSGETPEAAA
ncbi:MAG: CBS domain-containing protein [Phycisphaerales bacterium JB037]